MWMIDILERLVWMTIMMMLSSLASSLPAWTYASTASNCAGTSSSPCGPEYWDTIYSQCSSSVSSQSPINIVSSSVIEDKLMQGPIPNILGSCQTWYQGVVDSAMFQIAYDGSCSSLVVAYQDSNYTLSSIRFHSPAEHAIGGGYYSGEAQFIHTNSQGKGLTMVVLLEESSTSLSGTSNEFLSTIFSYSGGTAVGLSNNINIIADNSLNPYLSFLPAKPSQFYYQGSSSTPDCEGNVEYFVFEQTVLVSSNDIQLLRGSVAALVTNRLSSAGDNNRPLQSLDTRTIRRIVGGKVTTFAPTPMPTQATSAPSVGVVLKHTRLRRPRPGTALLIGSVALLVSVILIFLFSVYLIQLCGAFLESKQSADDNSSELSSGGMDDDSGDNVELMAVDQADDDDDGSYERRQNKYNEERVDEWSDSAPSTLRPVKMPAPKKSSRFSFDTWRSSVGSSELQS